jgi:hypothetical protein
MYFGMTLLHPNSIHEEIISRLNLLSFGAESLFFQFPIQKYRDKINRTIILLVVLCACEIWSLTLDMEHWLRAFEKRVLRKMLGPEKEEVTGDWRRLHKKDLYDLYSSSNFTSVIESRIVRWAGRVVCIGAYRLF